MFHARAATTGNARSPSVDRRVEVNAAILRFNYQYYSQYATVLRPATSHRHHAVPKLSHQSRLHLPQTTDRDFAYITNIRTMPYEHAVLLSLLRLNIDLYLTSANGF